MSASDKKKLRKEQESARLTQKQLAAQKEAKQVKLQTTIFLICMAVILVVAIVVGVRQTITVNGVMERKTTALTVGSYTISNAELNYYFINSVNNFMSTYGNSAAMFGLDTTQPLDQQMFDEESGKSWADYFLESAETSVQAVYAMCDAADAAGFTLSDEGKSDVDMTISSMDGYAALYGYADANAYLKAMYGHGANVDGYRQFLERSTLAQEYQAHYADSLSYTADELRAADSENPAVYSSYSYNTYYISTSRFLTGGTVGEDGTTTYSDEEKAAAVKDAESAAKELASQKFASTEDLDKAIQALSINKDNTSASSVSSTDVAYSSISGTYAEWVSDSARKAGDITSVPSTSGDEVNGYYVVYYVGSNDNTFPLSNVRHILVAFEGGTKDANTGMTTYSDEEKAAAKTEAEAILGEWKAGAATEESFAELANTKSDDGDGTTGGLYENIAPDSAYVTNFKQWALDDHKPGDTGIVETEYGYHVMFYSGETDYTYRDYKIETELRTEAVNAWYEETVAALEMTEGDTKYVRKDLILNSGN